MWEPLIFLYQLSNAALRPSSLAASTRGVFWVFYKKVLYMYKFTIITVIIIIIKVHIC